MTLTMPVNGVASKVDDVRRSLSKEADHLAEIAATYGRDISEHASDIADDATKQASKLANDQAGRASGWVSDVLKAAAGLGTAIALSGRKTADDLSDNAQTKAKELRNLRLTTEPKNTGPDFTPGVTLLAGFGAGIALMWFFDPERGKSRRNLLRDKLMSWTHKATQTASGTARDLSNRAQGAAYEAHKQVKGESPDLAADTDTQTWATAADQTPVESPSSY